MTMTDERLAEPVFEGMTLAEAAEKARDAYQRFHPTGNRRSGRKPEELAVLRRDFERARWEYVRRARTAEAAGIGLSRIARLSGVGRSQLTAWRLQVAAAERIADALREQP